MGISIWQLLIVLGIVVLIFGTKKLRNIGGDVGGAIKNFKQSMKEEGKEGGKEGGKDADKVEDKSGGRVIDAEVTQKDKDKA